MTIDKLPQLIFVGFNGRAAALDRDTGDIVWTNNRMKGGYVTLLLDGDRLIASTNGYIYCLNPYTGEILWHNPMVGFGYGSTSLVSVRGQSTPLVHHAAAADAESNSASTTSIAAGS
jgi:outer membrane protein assembly factor BamB